MSQALTTGPIAGRKIAASLRVGSRKTLIPGWPQKMVARRSPTPTTKAKTVRARASRLLRSKSMASILIAGWEKASEE